MQTKGFSPVWVSMCLLRTLAVNRSRCTVCKQKGEDNHVVMKFVPVLNTLSLFADEAGTIKTFFATLDRIGKTASWSFHQPSTLDALCARLKFSYWIISLLIGGIPAGSRRCRRPPSSSSTPPQSILLSLQVCHFLPS